jgi:hypothetical protein
VVKTETLVKTERKSWASFGLVGHFLAKKVGFRSKLISVLATAPHELVGAKWLKKALTVGIWVILPSSLRVFWVSSVKNPFLFLI